MYIFLKNIFNKKSIAILGSMIYILNPYYLGNIFTRGAIGEAAALTFLPLLFLGLYDLTKREGKKQYFIIIGTVGIAPSHNITLFFAAIFSVIYMIFNIPEIIKKPKKIIKYCIIDFLFIITLTAFYTVPLYLNKTNAEYSIFDNTRMWTNNDFAADNAIEITELFKNNPENTVIYKLGIPTIIGIFCLLVLLIKRKIKKEDMKTILTFMFLGLLSIFIATRYFPWKKVPEILCILQFPWRMLGFADLFLSLCASYGIINFLELKFKDQEDVLIGCTAIISFLTMIYAFNYSGIEIQDNSNDIGYEEYFSSEEKLDLNYLNKEYLPVNSQDNLYNYVLVRNKDTVSILKGRAEIKNQSKDDYKTEIEIRNTYEGTEIEFPYLYYLGYEAIAITDEGKEIEIETFESKNGFVSVEVPDKDVTKIIVQYKTPILYKIAYFISAVSLVVGLFLLYKKQKND